MGSRRAQIFLAVLAAALGFFVDAYDLILYSIVRVESLSAFGVPPDALLNVGVDLLNAQLVGMLLGGIVWGMWGDRFGRRRCCSARFPSIPRPRSPMPGSIRSPPTWRAGSSRGSASPENSAPASRSSANSCPRGAAATAP